MKFLYQLNNYLRDLAPLSTIEKERVLFALASVVGEIVMSLG